MSWFLTFLRSSIGAKWIVALTGAAMALFLVVHMLGNFNVYLGADAMNGYAYKLKSLGPLLWVARLGLIGVAILHVVFTLRLAAHNRSSRPVSYHKKVSQKASLSSRIMVWSGLTVLSFIVFHLAHFTLGLTHPDHFHGLDAEGRHDVYRMFILGFQDIGVSASYVIAMVLLAFHLSHGISSMFQTLGWNHPKYNPILKRVGPAYAAVIAIGNISFPLAVQLGWITLA